MIGGEVEVAVSMNPISDDNTESFLLKIPNSETLGQELNIFLTAPGFHFESDNSGSLPLDSNYGTEKTQPTPQTAHFRLTALHPGTTTIKADLYLGETFLKTLETTIEVSDIHDTSLLKKKITLHPRPVPQPDLILQARTEKNPNTPTCTFHYHLKSFRSPAPFSTGTDYPHTLPANWIQNTRDLLHDTLNDITGSLAEDAYLRLISLGQYLFQNLFPPELQKAFLSHIPLTARTLLIQADHDIIPFWNCCMTGKCFSASVLLSEDGCMNWIMPGLTNSR